MREADLKEFLTKRGIHPSFHRLKVLEFLLNHRIHPTAEEIYRALAPEIPTLSRTTVYNTLKLFVERGLLRQLAIEGNEFRYDIRTDDHAHFKCNRCGKVYDVELDAPVCAQGTVEGHLVESCEICLRGICRNCRRKSEAK